MTRIRQGLAALGLALVVVGTGVTDAAAGRRNQLRCRRTIAANLQDLIAAGLAQTDRCRARAAARNPERDCGDLTTAISFIRAQARAQGIVTASCPGGNPILDNFPIGSNDVVTVVAALIRRRLDQSVQSLPPPGGAVAPSRRCGRAIDHGRTATVRRIVADAIHCQNRRDRDASVLGEIDDACLGDAAATRARAATRITRACGGVVPGASCSPAPDCLLASAVRTGQALARDVYGALPEQRGHLCGNGDVDVGEECDDGNTDETDACTSECMDARCGDGFTEVGVEQCDDGNDDETDACTPRCELARCGDGIVETGVEECDDGPSNGTPGDPCGADCGFAEVGCSASGTVEARLTLVPARDGSTVDSFAGVTVEVTYPASVSIPGTGSLPVDDPADPATRIALLSDTLYSGLVIFNDTDALLRTTIGTSSPVRISGPLPFERIRFDCASGTTFTPAEFPCVVSDEAGALGNTIPPDQRPACALTLLATP